MDAEKVLRILRLVNRGTTLARELRQDPDLPADQIREKDRASKMIDTMHQIARMAVGCIAPRDCDCPICREEGPPR